MKKFTIIKNYQAVLAIIGVGVGLVMVTVGGNKIFNSANPPVLTETEQIIMTSSITEDNLDASQPISVIKRITETQEIPFETETRYDASLAKGQSRVENEGAKGERKIVYEAIIVNNQETDRKLISEEITKQPIKRVVVAGNKNISSGAQSNQVAQNNNSGTQSGGQSGNSVAPPAQSGNSYFNQAEAQRMLEFVNNERTKVGATPLYYSNSVAEYAKIRAREIVTLFSHTRPNGQPWYTLSPSLLNGENLLKASHVTTAEAAVTGWMNSPGHRENVLRPEFRSLGGALLYDDSSPEGYRYYWTQLFSVQ